MVTSEIVWKNRRVEYEGEVWRIDAKIWMPSGNRKGRIKVYRVHGDINKLALLQNALELETAALALGATLH